MTNMEALKAIFVALGGSEGDTASFKKLSDALEGISENVSGGGGGGGGDEILVVNVALDLDESVYVPDHTRAEVLEALQSGKTVLCNYSGAVSMFIKDADYPEIYTNLLYPGTALEPHTLALKYFYFEYAEDGTFTAEDVAVDI